MSRFTIAKGNAQVVYGIIGNPGEIFEVKNRGTKTMLPDGKFMVVETQFGGPRVAGKSFSQIVVARICELCEKASIIIYGGGAAAEQPRCGDHLAEEDESEAIR